MKINRYHVQGAIVGLALAALVPLASFAARTAAPILTGLFPSTTLSVNLPPPSISIGTATTTYGSVSNGTIYFEVTALDGVGESFASQLIGTTTLLNGAGWNITWTAIQGASAYRVYFSTSTPQTLTQYFNATTSSQYTFLSTSTPVFVANNPTANTAYVVNFSSAGRSWLNGGTFLVGTTTYWAAQQSIATSTAPQLLLTDTSNNAWSFRSVGGALFLATSTASATSSTSMFSLSSVGVATFNNNVTITTANTATSTLKAGCIQAVATSTATPIKLTLSTGSLTATSTYSGSVTGGYVIWAFGTCP